MFAHTGVLSLALSFATYAVGQDTGIQLDVNSQASIKSAAKTLAGGIISSYNATLKKDLVPGLFDSKYYYFREAGAVWNALVDYSFLTGDSQYDAIVSEALQFQVGDYNAYMPQNQTKTAGNDDQSVWALAAMTAAEVGFPKPKSGEWVDYAVNVWDIQAERLDYEEKNGTCGGGLRWQIYPFNNGYTYKNTASNGNFFLLSARLAKFTGNSTYALWADKSYKWANDIGLVSNYRVFDGADALKNCSSPNRIRWSSDHGVYTEGAAVMYNMTGAQNWTSAVKGFVDASSVFQSNESSVLVESACESKGTCDVDMRAFMGIFARTLARTALAAPIVSGSINKLLSTSAKAAASACSGGSDPSCPLSWTADSKWESASAKDGNLGEVFNALGVVQGLLYPSAKALKTAGGAKAGASGTTGGAANGTTGANAPQNTGAAGTFAASITAVFVVAFVAALSC